MACNINKKTMAFTSLKDVLPAIDNYPFAVERIPSNITIKGNYFSDPNIFVGIINRLNDRHGLKNGNQPSEFKAYVERHVYDSATFKDVDLTFGSDNLLKYFDKREKDLKEHGIDISSELKQ